MSQKLYLFLVCCLLALPFTNAQAQCPNPAYSATGLYPKPLPDGTENAAYSSQDLTFVLPKDSTFTQSFGGQTISFAVTYTSFTIDSTGGIPAEFSFDLASCSQPNCTYTIDPQVVNRGCIQLVGGTPAATGVYTPHLYLIAKGSFVMPALPIPIPVPGLPPAGTVIQLDSIGSQLPADVFGIPLASTVEGLVRYLTLSTDLTIKSTTVTPLCQDQIPVAVGEMSPADLGSTLANSPFNGGSPKDMVIDFAAKTSQSFGITSFEAVYSSYTIDSTGGMPNGMSFSVAGCPGTGNCVFNDLSQVDPGKNRVCFTFSGTPTNFGTFAPFVRAKAEGTVTITGGGLPAPITVDMQNPDLSQIPQQFQQQTADLIKGLANPTYETALVVTPDQFTQLCNPTVAYENGGGISPFTFPDGDITQNYNNGNPLDVTFDFPRTGIFTIDLPQVGTVPVSVVFTEFEITEAAGLPDGMSFNGYCPATGSCVRTVEQQDSAKNRICFTLNGNPTVGGNYEPFVKCFTDGNASLSLGGFNQNFLLSAAPTNLPVVGDISPQINAIREQIFKAKLKVEPVTAVEDLLNGGMDLYPNPTTETAVLKYDLKGVSTVNVEVADLTGRVVYSLKNLQQNAGLQMVQLNLANVNNGLYFVKTTINGQTAVAKLLKN